MEILDTEHKSINSCIFKAKKAELSSSIMYYTAPMHKKMKAEMKNDKIKFNGIRSLRVLLTSGSA